VQTREPFSSSGYGVAFSCTCCNIMPRGSIPGAPPYQATIMVVPWDLVGVHADMQATRGLLQVNAPS
jgi:hypothetical protein